MRYLNSMQNLKNPKTELTLINILKYNFLKEISNTANTNIQTLIVYLMIF